MANINPTLGSNFQTETIMKIVAIIYFCLQPNHVLQPTMSHVIDEIYGALELEGLDAEEGATKIEIPQYTSQLTLLRYLFQINLDQKRKMDELIGALQLKRLKAEEGATKIEIPHFELVDINRKGKRQQQPQTIFTQSHGSRSVFQIVLISHLMQEMTRGLIVNNLCCGIV